MSIDLIALASQIAALPGVHKLAGEIENPSSLTLIVVALSGVVIGRLLSGVRAAPSQD